MAEAINLAEILREPDVLLDVAIEAKSALLAEAAKHMEAAAGIPSDVILKALSDREKLGSTAINHGVAVPHAGIGDAVAPAGVFFRLARPLEFDAPDNNPVDLVFVLIWPEERRSGLLATLGGLCRELREGSLLDDLREAPSRAAIRALLDDAHG